jgi:hypothetical protein
MHNKRIAFKFLQDNESVPPGYKFNFEAVKTDFTRRSDISPVDI